MKWFYKSLREYQRIKNISYTKAKNLIKKEEILVIDFKWKRVIVDIKETIKYLITYL